MKSQRSSRMYTDSLSDGLLTSATPYCKPGQEEKDYIERKKQARKEAGAK